jgi:hypothetical protein
MPNAQGLLDRRFVVTGWGATVSDLAPRVTMHAIVRDAVDSHVAVCGAAIPVVERKRPWAAGATQCCAHCSSAVA